MNTHWMHLAALLSMTTLYATLSPAQETQEAAHNELRALHKELVDAVTKQDLDRMTAHVTKDVVVTWQNGDVNRGVAALREWFARVQMGSKVFKGYKVPPTPDDLTILYGGTVGVSYGQSVGLFSVAGREFEVKNRWTAAVVKEDGRWRLASYHVSTNALDNPVLNAAKQGLYWAAGVALLVGLAVGAGGAHLLARRARRPAA